MIDDIPIDADEVLPEENPVFFHKPPLLKRIKAMFVDSLVIVGLMYLAFMVINALGSNDGRISALFFSLVVFYEPVMVSLGGTIGHRVMGLRICEFSRLQNGEVKSIHFILAILRFLVKALLGWISLLTIHSDKYGQAIHDKMSSSVVTFNR